MTESAKNSPGELQYAFNAAVPMRWLPIARVTWWLVTLIVVVLNFISIPIIFRQLSTLCTQPPCNWQFTTAQAQRLQNLGLSVEFTAALLVAVLVLVGFIYIIVALIIFLRQSDRRIGLLSAFTLVLFGAVSLTETPAAVASVYPQLLLPIYILDYIGVILLPLFVIIFPDGWLKPRWTIGLIIAWAIIRIPSYFLQGSALDSNTWPFMVQVPLWFGFIASLILIQQYRYRKVYGPVLRQQTKWVVYGMMVSLAGFIITQSVFAFIPVPVVLAGVSIIFANILMYLLMLMIPVSIAIAVLRYKLWDIDLIINRTLVYVPLTAIVGGLFSASTTLTQKVFIATTGQASDAVLVITTFVIVTTFTPIKNALQAAVDKRFKEPNNPVKEINAFDNQVRSVVEVLDARTITDRLLNTSLAAFHPSGGAVYLYQSGKEVKVHATPGWKEDDSRISLPLEWNGKKLGMLCLGAREAGLDYSLQESQALQQAATRVAHVIAGFELDI